MEKSIEQLLEISKNPYYTLTIEENERLEAFLSKNSAQQTRQLTNGDSSERNIPATVLNKNKVKKETGEIPTVDNVAVPTNGEERKEEAAAAEEAVHPDAVN